MIEQRAKKSIAVTGGIGSGKSCVSRYWANFSGFPLINIDQICAELIAKDNKGWQLLCKEFNNYFLLQNGEIDRKKLRTEIFTQEDVRKKVNALLHPLAYEKTIEEIKKSDSQTVIVDVPLLFEAGWENMFDCKVVVFAGPELCCRRIVNRDKVNSLEAAQSLSSQISIFEKIMLADHVINNSGCWTATILEIIHLSRYILGG